MLLLILTPLPYGSVEVWSMTLWEVWVFVTTVLWVILTIRDGEFRLEPTPLLLPMVALLVMAIVQLVPIGAGPRRTISLDPYLTLQATIKLFASVLFFALFSTFVDTDERRQFAVKVILAMCILIALIGVGQNYVGRAL